MKVLTLIVGLTPLAGGPVFAQQASGAVPYGYTLPPGTLVMPDQGANGAIPPVDRQIRAARSFETVNAGRQPCVLLRQTDQALTRC